MPVTLDSIWNEPELRIDIQNGAKFPLADFTAEEQLRFQGGFDELFFNRGGAIRTAIDSRKIQFIAGARAAKLALKNKSFGGISGANTDIGMSPVRPGHVGFTQDGSDASTSGKPNNIWRFTFGAGNNNWIGSGTATPLTMGQNEFIVNVGLLELGPGPIADTVKIDIGRASVLPLDTHALRVPDLPGAARVPVLPLPATFWPASETISVQVWSDNGGTAELVPLGITYGLGTFLSQYPTYTTGTRTA